MYDIFNWTNDVNIMEVSLYFKKQKIIFRNKQQMNIIIFITRQSKLLSYSKYVTLNCFKQLSSDIIIETTSNCLDNKMNNSTNNRSVC